MDTLLYGGDFAKDARGYPVLVSGVQELLQQALIRLKVKKGSFVYDPELGSELHTLQPGGSDLSAQALRLAREALKQMGSIQVQQAAVRRVERPENLEIVVTLKAVGQNGQWEVVV